MSGQRGDEPLTISNDTLRIGVDSLYGGAITHLSSAAAPADNLINLFDMGRQVQQSYYSGPQPFGRSHPDWPDWPWNPIGAGDVYGHASRVVALESTADSLHVEAVPLQWALDDVAGECTFDTWITLEGATARVRNRLTNNRADTTLYPPRHQELPAVYTVGRLHHLISYRGLEPFTGAPAVEIINSGPPWEYWTATEAWAALVDDSGWGVGVVHPGALSFVGGFHGERGAGGPHEPATGYMSPLHRESLDHDIVYEYEYLLVLGEVDDVRRTAVAERPHDPFSFDFTHDRAHWTSTDLRDRASADGGRLLSATGPAPRFASPTLCWHASEIAAIEVLGRGVHGPPGRIGLRWRCHDQEDFPADQMVSAMWAGGDRIHFALDEQEGWRGIISELQVELPPHGDTDSLLLTGVRAIRRGPLTSPSWQ